MTMMKQKSGSIVNISTSLVDQAIACLPAGLPILTKGALHAVTRGLATECVAHGVRVNAVSAGMIDTPLNPREIHDFLKTLGANEKTRRNRRDCPRRNVLDGSHIR